MSTKTKLAAAAATIAAQRQLLYRTPSHFTVSWRWHCLLYGGGFILILFTCKRYVESIFIRSLCCKQQSTDAWHQRHNPPDCRTHKTTRNRNRYCAHFMTVNSIFNNSKMILWFGIVRGGGGGNAVRDAMRSDARWKCQLLNILSSQY